ncbi:MAG: hypothetical protein A2Y16_01575 [Tenericutes bacterium GWF2_57_13]|nr:MAG: hypothetical protein A2Y16_01575 [Tenericutes bacterium GWF2_57_13]
MNDAVIRCGVALLYADHYSTIAGGKEEREGHNPAARKGGQDIEEMAIAPQTFESAMAMHPIPCGTGVFD